MEGQRPYSIIVGIDPDVDKSGLAVVEVSRTEDNHYPRRLTACTSLRFPELLERVASEQKRAKAYEVLFVVVVEAGWLNKSHWHLPRTATTRMAAAIGNAAGRNHETGRKIVEMLRHYSVDTREVKPLALSASGIHQWSGKDGKCTSQEFRRVTSWLSKTNQEGRDAGLLAWTFPISLIKTGQNVF